MWSLLPFAVNAVLKLPINAERTWKKFASSLANFFRINFFPHCLGAWNRLFRAGSLFELLNSEKKVIKLSYPSLVSRNLDTEERAV